MYESKFGLSGPPFQLNPDPAFYFDSRGHSNALSYLKFGVHQGEGFIVVTGEIGAGKTTLVRTLLEGVNSDEVAAAQVLNTQLESGELLQAILTAFGVASPAGSKAQLLASLEAFLTSVAAEGRRALLVVDEAQNLGREAIEELRMLSNFQLGNHALLQSFLIGQPELRKQLESPAMEQLRQRVIASCHLGPLGAEETRAYIEHRLRHVGWVEQPSFDDAAFEVIHQWTGGIPRKINLLCNRLLLAAFLSDEGQITGALVRSTAGDLARETGGARVPVETTPAPREQPALAAVAPMPGSRGAVAKLPEEREIVRVAGAGVDTAVLRAPLVLLVDSPLGAFKAAVLAKALSAHEELPPTVLVTSGEPGDADPGALAPGLSESLALQIHLRAGASGVAERLAAVARRLDLVLDELQPSAMLTFGAGDDVLMSSLLANKRGLPLAHLGSGQRRDIQSSNGDTNAVLIDRLSDVLYTSTLKAHYTLYKEGISADRMVCVGNPLSDGLRPATSLMPPVSELLKGAGLSREQLRRALRGYALVSAQTGGELTMTDLLKVARVARDLGRETLVVWIVSEGTAADIRTSRADALLQKSGVVLVPGAGYAMRLGLLRGATCTIAGPDWELVEESDLLDIPSIVLHPDGDVPPCPPGGVIARIACDSGACVRALHEILERGRADDESTNGHDGSPVQRIADHLRRWLNGSSAKRSDPTLSNAAA
jgi:putative secretion ATPase (PEP-CTERM system associated)